MKESTKEDIDYISVGLGVRLKHYMKLNGWLPVGEYFEMKRNKVDLDFVEVLTLEKDGFAALPRMAEYIGYPKLKKGKSLAGWYDSNSIRIDNDFTSVVFFRTVQNPLDDLKSYIRKESVKIREQKPDWKLSKKDFIGQIMKEGEDAMQEYTEYVHKHSE